MINRTLFNLVLIIGVMFLLGLTTLTIISKSEGFVTNGFLTILSDILQPLAIPVFWLIHFLTKHTALTNTAVLVLSVIIVSTTYVLIYRLLLNCIKNHRKII